MTITAGVLALKGGVREHVQLLEHLGTRVRPVRRLEHLDGLDALVLPGGESSTIDRLTRIVGIREPLRAAIAGGLPTLGTCAGLIMLAHTIIDPAPGQTSLGILDIAVRRNAFGPQTASDERVLETSLGQLRAAFIRAPQVISHGHGVEVVATLDTGEIVGVRQGSVIGISFHPELTGDGLFHRELLRMTAERRRAAASVAVN